MNLDSLPGILTSASDRADVRRVLFYHGTGLGDAVVAERAVRAVKHAFPKARLDVMLPPRGRSLQRLGYPGDVFPPYANLEDEELPFADYEVIIDGLPIDLLDRPLYRQLSSGAHVYYAFGYRAGDVRTVPSVERWRQSLNVLGIECGNELPSLIVPERANHTAGEILYRHFPDWEERLIIAIQPGSGWPYKRWPTERFATVAHSFVKQHNAIILLLTNTNESALSHRFLQFPGWSPTTYKNIIPMHAKPLPTVAGLLTKSTFLLSNDSGLAHVAAALGTAVVVVFGPTNPYIWSPSTDRVVVSGNYPCCPSESSQCGLPCLDSVSTNQVTAAAEALLTETYGRHKLPSLDSVTLSTRIAFFPTTEGVRLIQTELKKSIEIKEGGAFILAVLSHIEQHGSIAKLLYEIPDAEPLLSVLFGYGIVVAHSPHTVDNS